MQEMLSNYRCECGKMLLRGFIFVGEVEIKCRFCKKTIAIGGINGTMSNDHRYILIAEQDGKISHVTASSPQHLGYSQEELLNMRVHEVVQFDRTYYMDLWKRLEEKHRSFVLFQTQQVSKDGKSLTVQVGARIFVSAIGRKLFLFDIETKPPRKKLPKTPLMEKAPKAAKASKASGKKQTAQ